MKNKPIIISTGRSNISDIDQAIKYINRNGNNKISILHCVSSYPTKYQDLNLNVINQLKNGVNITKLINNILDSNEYTARFY